MCGRAAGRTCCAFLAPWVAFVMLGASGDDASLGFAEDPPSGHPLSEKRRAELQAGFEKAIREATAAIADDPKSVAPYSRRGDAHFFAGKFKEAVSDYEMMVEIDPALDASHWRRGIAYFYAGRPKDGARQFERYHTFDDVDRENGIWRYLSQYRGDGPEKAREGLLKYKKDDREPFPSVYRLFARQIAPDEILAAIREAKIDDDEREKRLFYAQLYIGLDYAVQEKPKLALPHLREAVANTWGPTAGGGPTWMWHVGRVHYELLSKPAATP